MIHARTRKGRTCFLSAGNSLRGQTQRWENAVSVL
ncbi:hypothetical protein DESA109040_04670 [Deinococcus saxicola]